MIYALKLLFVVLLVCGITAMAFRRGFRELLSEPDYRHAWKLIVSATLVSFLCKFPPLFLLAYAGVAMYAVATTGNRVVGALSVYLLLTIVAPPIAMDIGGVGGINYLLRLDHQRLLALAVLVGAALRLASAKRDPGSGGFLSIDLCVVGYALLRLALSAPHSNATTLTRQVIETSLDGLLPYYVATRSIRTLAELRFVAAHLALGLVFLACVAVAEFATQRNYYTGLQAVYDVKWQLSWELVRGGLIRVQATTEQPIILAVSMVFGAGLWIWLKGGQWKRAGFLLGLAAFVIALVGSWSRGPWLACGVLFIVLLALHKLSAGAVRVLLLLTIAAGVIAKSSGADSAITNALAALFGGTGEDLSTIDYRRELLDTSLALIKQSPWFGVPNYGAQMQELRQGQGIIDIVNSYIGIMLNVGVVGLLLYLTPFIIVIHRMLSAIQRDESGKVGQGSRFAVSMVAMNIACLFAIFTTSTFGVLSTLMTLLVALPASWLAMPAQERDSPPLPAGDDETHKGLPARYGPIQSRTT